MTRTNRRSKQSSPIHASASDPNEKQIYEERIRELEAENKAYQAEISELRQQQQGSDSSASRNGVEKLKKEYLQKLNLLEDQVTELKTKLGTRSQFSQRKKVDESTKQLQFEIQNLKAQKVQLHCKLKLESVQFRLCKTLLEKEVLQLKKEGRRNGIKTQSLLASKERLKMVLQRKTEEASAATKRVKDMIVARKAISHRSSGARSRNGQLIQDAEEELVVKTQLHKLCSQYESKMEKMAGEIARLNEEIEMHRQEKFGSELQEEDCDSLEKDSEIQDLKEQMNSLGCLLRELQSRKEKLDFKDKKQGDLGMSLLYEESNDKIKMNTTPEMSSASENSVKRKRTGEGLCCSCSKKSLCKTNKCKCRSSGGSCGASCGCTHLKCTNREPNQLSGNEPLKSDNTKCTVEALAEDKDGSVIASECAKLLQSALVQKPASCKDNLVPIKKPLRDIQNSMLKLDDQKQGKKKKGRKPEIQLVTKDPIKMSSSPENSSSVESTTTVAATDELATSISDAPGFRRLRNPSRQVKSVVGKENCFI